MFFFCCWLVCFFGGGLRKLEDAGKGRLLLGGPRELLLEERPGSREPVCETTAFGPVP